MRIRIPHSILAVDPGNKDAGAARLVDGQLAGAWWLRPKLPRVEPCRICVRKGVACEHAAGPLRRWAMLRDLAEAAGEMDHHDLVLVEDQYLPRAGKLNPAPLLQLAQMAGAVAAAAALAGVRVVSYIPREWKGTTDKEAFQRQILACLQPAELELVPRAPQTGRYLSDPVDAVGLALFGAQRLGRQVRRPEDFTGLVESVHKRRDTKE